MGTEGKTINKVFTPTYLHLPLGDLDLRSAINFRTTTIYYLYSICVLLHDDKLGTKELFQNVL
jgi:hypothetical protein